jgi:hypothetical protein
MPRGREIVQSDTRQLPAETEKTSRQTSPKRPARPAPSNGKVRPVSQAKANAKPEKKRAFYMPRLSWPKLSFFKKQSKAKDAKASTNGHVEIPLVEEVPAVIDLDQLQTGDHAITAEPKGKPWRSGFKKFVSRVRKPPSKTKKPKKQKRRTQTKRGRGIKWLLIILIGVILPIGFIEAFVVKHKVKIETQARQTADTQTENQLKVLGASTEFPLSNAEAKAALMAYDCFTVPSYGADPEKGDLVAFQYKALADDGIRASDSVNCGWDGKGRGKVDLSTVVTDQYWVHGDRATIILELKLYQRPGSFYYFVPFKNNNGVAEVAGMPSIFGSGSGAMDFLASCPDPSDSANTDQMRHTAQLFVSALAGDSNIDLGYLTYDGAKFGGFGKTVSSPKIMQIKYCGSNGDEKRFAAMVRFNGPVQGSHYSLPYAFGVVPNAETSGRYQVKEFGPVPGYTGD